MIKIVIVVLIIWLVCGILTYGILFAWCQEHFPNDDYKANLLCSIFLGFLGGPIALIVTVATLLINKDGTLKHGLKFW